jgi:hypothetical protein
MDDVVSRPTSAILSLPTELLIQTFSHLEYWDLANVQRVCKKFWIVTQNSSEIWGKVRSEEFLDEDFEHICKRFEMLMRRSEGKVCRLDLEFRTPFWCFKEREEQLLQALKLFDPGHLEDLRLGCHKLYCFREEVDVSWCESILKVLSDGTRIKALRLDNVLFDDLNPTTIWRKGLPALRSLILSGTEDYRSDWLFQWLSATKDTLEKLELWCAAPCLEEIPSPSSETPIASLIVPIQMLKLKTLTLDWQCYNWGPALVYLPKLEFSVLESVTLYDGKYTDSFLACIFVATVVRLNLKVGKNTEKALCKALPKMNKLESIALNLKRKSRVIDILTMNPRIRVRDLSLQCDDLRWTGPGLVKLCESRGATGTTKLVKLTLSPDNNIEKKHHDWLKKHVEEYHNTKAGDHKEHWRYFVGSGDDISEEDEW